MRTPEQIKSSRANSAREVKGHKRGTGEWKRLAQARALVLWRTEPRRTMQSIADEIGASLATVKSWCQGDDEFRRQYNYIRHTTIGDGSPAPGNFIDWRATYVNVASENPYTAKTAHVGVTWPFIEDFAKALESTTLRRLLYLIPVRMGKTTLVEQFVIYALCRDPNARVIIICASEKHAKERAWNIQRVLQDDAAYPELHQKWGAWIGKPESRSMPWGRTSFYVRGRNSPERSPSVSCYGISAKVYGARADIIVLDDVDDPGNGPDTRDEILRAINGPVISRLGEGGKLIVIGTRCGADDVYSRLMEKPGWWVKVKSAIQDDGTALCPEMYDIEELESFRNDMGEVAFQMMCQNNPSPEGSSVFPPDLIDSAKGHFDIGEAPEDWERIISLDPSTSGKAALAVLAHNPSTREIRVIDLDVKGAPRHDGMRNMLAAALGLYRPRYVVIEAQGGSHLLSDSPDIKSMIYDAGARLIEFQTGVNKHDPTQGIPLVATLMAQGRLRIANAGNASARMKALYDDMVSWRPQTTSKRSYDTVMAVWFGCNVIHLNRKPGAKVRSQADYLAGKYRSSFSRWGERITAGMR